MPLTDYLMIATVLKPQGVHGECKLRSWAADIERFRRWTTLYRKSGTGFEPVSVRVARIRDGFVYAYLNDSTDVDQAESFRGTDLYVDRAHAAPMTDDAVLIADLVGCEALDEQGTLMAPALKAVFPVVDTEKKTVLVVREKLEEVCVRS